jgi:hypothetical protein
MRVVETGGEQRCEALVQTQAYGEIG